MSMNERPGRIHPAYLNLGHYIETPVIEQEVGVGGEFGYDMLNRAGEVVRPRVNFENTVLDVGIAAMCGAGRNYYNLAGHGDNDDFGIASSYCVVGTDGTAPATGQSGIIASAGATYLHGGHAHEGRQYHSAEGYWDTEGVWLFDFNQANAVLAEVGTEDLYRDPDKAWTRQLFKDEQGNPITITKTDEEQLRIYYKRRIAWPAVQTVQNAVDISGTAHDVTTQPVDIDDRNWYEMLNSLGNSGSGVFYENLTLPASFEDEPATSNSIATQGPNARTNGSTFYEVEYRLAPSEGNVVGGIEGIRHGPSSPGEPFATHFDPPIVKTDTEELIARFRYNIGRIS